MMSFHTVPSTTIEDADSARCAEAFDRPRWLTRYWLACTASVFAIIILAAICWSSAHPFGIHWDESGYLDETLIDVQRLRHLMLHKLGGRILFGSWGRPPAYRLIADPILAVFGTATATARLVSLACFSLAAWFVFLSGRLLGGRVAGAFAALLFCLSPEVIAASSFFGTDASLYLATSAMLFFLFRRLRDSDVQSWDWIGLGFAVSLGFLSKTSFFVLGPPGLLVWLAVCIHQKRGRQGVLFLMKAGLLSALLAGPWWYFNFRGAVEYARYARGFVRNSLGSPSISTWLKWLDTVAQCLLGHGVTLVTCLVVIAFLVKGTRSTAARLSKLQRSALWICASTGLPIIATQIVGTNHLLRHISPAVIPMAIVVGILADLTIWTRALWATAVVSSALVAQLCMIVYPVVFPNRSLVEIGFVNGALPWRTFARFDQWDWHPILDLSNACGVPSPKISYLGGGREFNPAAISYPWAAQARSETATIAYPTVSWLWRYEDGVPNWTQIMSAAKGSDFILTAPHYVGEVTLRENEDNQFNSDFVELLSESPNFVRMPDLHVGRFEPIAIAVFRRRELECKPMN